MPINDFKHGEFKNGHSREFCPRCLKDTLHKFLYYKMDRYHTISDVDYLCYFQCVECADVNYYPSFWFEREALRRMGLPKEAESLEDL
jgi:hypothetical protein